ncbi:hypothetical protein GCM10020256_13570 [Streptomyces thermocoprophilus]
MTGPIRYTETPSPLGTLLLTADPDGSLTSLSVPGQRGGRTAGADWVRDPALFRDAEEQLAAYFAGDLKEFRLRLRPPRHRLPAARMGRPGRRPLRRDQHVRRDRRPHRRTQGRRPCRRRRDRRQPAADPAPLPPGDRRERHPHRLRGRP